MTLEHGTGLGGKLLHQGVEIARDVFRAKKIYLEAQEYAICCMNQLSLFPKQNNDPRPPEAVTWSLWHGWITTGQHYYRLCRENRSDNDQKPDFGHGQCSADL